MKKYYQTLDKDQKEKAKKLYEKEYKKKDLDIRLTRLFIYAIIGYVSSIIFIIETIILEKEKIVNFVLAGVLLIASTIFIIGRYKIKLDILNKIALKNK